MNGETVKTRAVALRTHPVTETSRVVTWLTEDAGKISTLIKGSQRPKSGHIGQYDLFYTCELLYYPRLRTQLHIVRECSPLQTRDVFRSDWARAAVASYCCYLADRASWHDEPAPRLFSVLLAALDHLESRAAGAGVIFWYELQVLGELGVAPRLRHCLQCGRPLAPETDRARFSHARGGILCERCAETGQEEMTSISSGVLAVLIAWQHAGSPAEAESTRPSPRQLTEVNKLLDLFLRYHLDHPLPARRLALEILRETAKSRKAATP